VTSGSIPTPGLPRATLGLRGPVGRALGDQLPQALAWGVGIGSFGLLLAALSRSFGDSLLVDYPTFAEFLETVFPTLDLGSAGWFLQLVFVEMGLIVIGFAAATFVGRWASDEGTGRLEMVLSAPLTRARWTLAGGVGAVLAVAVTTVVFALGIAIGAVVAGSDVLTPTAGAIALGLFGAAMVGIGVAVGGLWTTSWAAEVVAGVVIATFLVNLLAPALRLPDWVGQLALSAHLGQPMVGIWDWGGLLACAAIAVGGLLLGAWGMRRRDVAR
jgi:ABC-2 type transport system permease protein